MPATTKTMSTKDDKEMVCTPEVGQTVLPAALIMTLNGYFPRFLKPFTFYNPDEEVD
jgi:hypothetical protein